MKKSAVTNVILSDGTVAVYQEMIPQYGGIKYSVTEGDLKADLEITPNGDIYINDKKVKITVTEETVLKTENDMISPMAGGWSEWTKTPLFGNEGSYTERINTKYSNVVLENFLMALPESVLLTAIGGVATGWGVLGLTVLKQTKTFYSYVSLNPKELNFYEEQYQPLNYYKANQYRLWWLKSWKGTKLHVDPQIRYFTIG